MKINAYQLTALSMAVVAACGSGLAHAGDMPITGEDSLDVSSLRPTAVSVYRAVPSVRLPSSRASLRDNPAFAQYMPDLYCALAPADDKSGAH
ncbi:hypothetical protein LMG28727_06727 [Paraburkholderia kirstenboschensis]|uniref:hypothetical protein n=1 Tax=Paraburkholderia kirstenboschensis TaxID=1245436 RepID=UPI000A52BFD5|nr:hypothetical protein [Paraburkholderia kirstenboschensis]CAD6558821.1 hypothetical protein LMG28727_06727 [Paraburkholderia kirstenboschensis]